MTLVSCKTMIGMTSDLERHSDPLYLINRAQDTNLDEFALCRKDCPVVASTSPPSSLV